MKLKSLDLENVCLHRKRHIDFEDGLIGFFGPIGSGKSTGMNAAYAALTNDFSRIIGGKEGAICQQAEGHEPSRIVLEATHAGNNFEVTRQLQPGMKHKLSVNGGKPLTKAGEIQTMLEGVLGANRRMLDDYVFVEQWALRKLFQATQTERAKTLSHLCDTTHSEKCWDLVGKRRDADSELAAQVVDNSDEIREILGAVKSKRGVAGEFIEGHKKKLLGPKAKKKVEKILKDWERWKDLNSNIIPQTTKDEKEHLAAAKAARKAFKDAKTNRDRKQQLCDRLDGEAATAKSQLKSYARRLKDWNRKDAKTKSWEALKAKTFDHPDPPCEESASDIQDLLNTLAGDMAVHSDFLEGLSELEDHGEATCPTCHQSLEDVQKHIDEAEEALKPLEAKKQELRVQFRHRASWETTCHDLDKDAATNTSQIEVILGDLGEMQDITEPEAIDKEALDAAVKEAEDATTRHQAQCKVYDKALVAETAAITTHKATKTKLTKETAELASITLTPAETTAAETRMTEHKAAALEIHAQEALIETYDEQIAEREEELEQIQTVLARSVKARGWLDLLDGVRSVLHRDALPRIVHHNALRRMENGINELLDVFEQPWYVTTSDDLSYVAHFRNGTVMPDVGLSGGQQVILALAFRWVLNSLFASQIGMMVLDEPTAGLDARHLALLETALIGLGEAARSRGYQVIIITHQMSLERVFDQVITLEKAME